MDMSLIINRFAEAQAAVAVPAKNEPAPPAYTAGYLEGAMETLLLRLKYDSRENLAAFIRESLAASKVMR